MNQEDAQTVVRSRATWPSPTKGGQLDGQRRAELGQAFLGCSAANPSRSPATSNSCTAHSCTSPARGRRPTVSSGLRHCRTGRVRTLRLAGHGRCGGGEERAPHLWREHGPNTARRYRVVERRAARSRTGADDPMTSVASISLLVRSTGYVCSRSSGEGLDHDLIAIRALG